MAVRPSHVSLGYICVVTGAYALAILLGWTSLGDAIDGTAYDWTFKLQKQETSATHSVVLAVDEATLRNRGGVGGYRRMLAGALNAISGAHPKAVAIDILLADKRDPAEDAALASALAQSPNVVLGSDVDPERAVWEDPQPDFAQHAAAIGHVHTRPDPISRVIPLREIAGHKRRWAVALEAFRLFKGAQYVVESPDQLEVGDTDIKVGRASDAPMYVQYVEREDGASSIPHVSIDDLLNDPSLAAQVRDKAVFIGVTALSAARDRLTTPNGVAMSGVEIHAQAFETMVRGRFLSPASNVAIVGTSLLLALGAGLAFFFLRGWASYSIGAALIVIAHALPHLAFAQGIIFPLLFPVLSTWFSVVAAAAWMYFVVRRQLDESESDRARYQQAIHFVTHEMRSPLTAIQGSSELMGRYNLNEEKRKQMAQMINSESKRLAKMIQTFLDVERLSQGEMELRTEAFEAATVIEACLQRVQPLADRKQIRIQRDEMDAFPLTGDRELMEYAVYNLLTNAVKYSPADTLVSVKARQDGPVLRLSVADQGIGMDEKELKNIFKKFYRTKKAEKSGEVGTGIGLSIVEQIVTHHGGHIEVTSTPGRGSCFTMVLPRGLAQASVPASTLASN